MQTNKDQKTEEISNLYFNDLVWYWIEEKKQTVKLSTYSSYLDVIKCYIMPYFKDILLNNLSDEVLIKYIYKVQNNQLSYKNNIGSKTANDILIILKNICCFAENKYNIPNYIKNIKPILIETNRKTEILSKEEQKIILKSIYLKNDGNSISIMISLFTGMNLGELCGLKWKDINFEREVINVKRVVTRIKYIYGEKVKSKLYVEEISGRTINKKREVPIPHLLIERLKEYELNKNNDEDFIVTNSVKIPEPRNIQNYSKKVMEQCGIKPVGFSILKKCFAVRCIETGFSSIELMDILGVSNVQSINQYILKENDKSGIKFKINNTILDLV